MGSCHVLAALTLCCLLEIATSAAVSTNHRTPLRRRASPLRHVLRKRLFVDTKTTYPPTTIPHGCFYNGQHYRPGETIQNTPCHIIMCGAGGQLIWGDCTTTTPPPTTTPLGCDVTGRWYPPNSQISHGADYDSNWCYGMYCDEYGQIQYWDNFKCYESTTPGTTIPPTTVPAGV